MTGDKPIRWWIGALLVAAALFPPCALAVPQTAQPSAGKITALVPAGSVLRQRKSLEAQKEMPLFWDDNLRTDRGGRARVRLEDGSILNVGSQASLLVRKHDPGKQQTDLELIYGKVRADVTKIADAIATVKDQASAKAAAGVIASTNTELAALIKQIDAMSDTDKASAAMANLQELVAAQQKIAIAMSNMAMNNPTEMKIVADELGKMPELKTN